MNGAFRIQYVPDLVALSSCFDVLCDSVMAGDLTKTQANLKAFASHIDSPHLLLEPSPAKQRCESIHGRWNPTSA